jgi:hypothetical protein
MILRIRGLIAIIHMLTYVKYLSNSRTSTNIFFAKSMSSGGVSCKVHFPTNQTGLAPAHPTRVETSSVYTCGELAVQGSLLFFTMVLSMLANGSLHREYIIYRVSEILLTAARTIEYIAQQLIHGYKSGDNVTQAFLNNYDFYIFPFVNPDGMNTFVSVESKPDLIF